MKILRRYLQLINEIELALGGLGLDDLQIFSKLLAKYCKKVDSDALKNFLSSLATFAEDFGYDFKSIIRKILDVRSVVEGYLNGRCSLEKLKNTLACNILGEYSTVSEQILSELREYELYLKVLKIAERSRAEYLVDLPDFIEFLELEEGKVISENEKREIAKLKEKLTKLGVRDGYHCISKYLDLAEKFKEEYRKRAEELIKIERKVTSLQ